MKNLKIAIEKIKKFSEKGSLSEIVIEDGLVYTPLKIKDISYGFTIFSEEKYEPNLKSLNDCQYKHRYYYYEQFNNNNDKNILFIMFNPSSACPDIDDPTIKNCRKLVQDKYKGMEIINIFSERNPNVKNINTKSNTVNYDFIKELLATKQNIDIVIAWGYGKNQKYKTQIEEVKKLIANNPNKYKITIKNEILLQLKNCDRHPSPTAWGVFGGFDNGAELTKYN